MQLHIVESGKLWSVLCISVMQSGVHKNIQYSPLQKKMAYRWKSSNLFQHTVFIWCAGNNCIKPNEVSYGRAAGHRKYVEECLVLLLMSHCCSLHFRRICSPLANSASVTLPNAMVCTLQFISRTMVSSLWYFYPWVIPALCFKSHRNVLSFGLPSEQI